MDKQAAHTNGHLQYPVNLESIANEPVNPDRVLIKFKEDTGPIEALNEIGFLLSDFYSQKFRTDKPHHSLKKFGLKQSKHYDWAKISRGELTLILEGTFMEYGFQRGHLRAREETVRLGFFDILPFKAAEFEYFVYFSRRANDFSQRSYISDEAIARKEVIEFVKYIRGLMVEPPKPQAHALQSKP